MPTKKAPVKACKASTGIFLYTAELPAADKPRRGKGNAGDVVGVIRSLPACPLQVRLRCIPED